MNIKPLKKKVLVAESKKESKTDSGIIIEGTRGSGNTTTGIVLEIGPDVTMVAIGDEIFLDWAKTSVVKVGDAQRVIIDEDNIIAVVEK
jgi:co-chaperonin GroES (HSP10)